MSEFFVYADIDGDTIYAGKCYYSLKSSANNNTRVSSLFSYADAYLSRPGSRNIDPVLVFDTGAQPAAGQLHGVFRDSAPDRWGRMLIDHRYRKETQITGTALRALSEVDYLLGVSDLSRQGNIRFTKKQDGVFEHPDIDIPKLIELPQLMRAAASAESSNEEMAIRMLIDAGSASLGGARPKASVRDEEKLYIAKFPHRHDKWDVIAWEWAAMMAASAAGINIPKTQLIDLEGKHVLLSERFDRNKTGRIGFISAMTLLGKQDGESGDYADIALGLSDISASPAADLAELYRRILFSILINNTDDHLKNHGLTMYGSAWRLAPAYDINPNPNAREPRVTSVFGETTCAAVAALNNNLDIFGLSAADAERIQRDVIIGAEQIISFAGKAGVKKSEQQIMNAVFEQLVAILPTST